MDFLALKTASVRRCYRFFVVVCAGVAVLTVSVVRAEPVSIESRAFALTIESTTGQIVSLRDKATDTPLLAGPGSDLFRISGPSGAITSADSPPISVEVQGDRLTIHHRFVRDRGHIDVRLHLVANANADPVTFEIQVENNAQGHIVEMVDYPIIPLRRLGDADGGERVFTPGGEGAVTYGQGVSLVLDWAGLAPYPGHASMQFTAHYNDRLGVGLMAQDSSGASKMIGFWSARYGDQGQVVDLPGLRLGHQLLLPRVADRPIQTYPVVLYPVKEHWMAAAEPYRRWAQQQPWVRPKAEDDRSPAWVRSNPVVIESRFLPRYLGLRLMPLASIPRILNAWSDEFGGEATILPLFRAFERYGENAVPHFRPFWPSDQTVTATWRGVRNAGHRSMAMIAAMVWQLSTPEFIAGWSYWVQGFDGRIEMGGDWVDGWTGLDSAQVQRFDPTGPDVCTIEPNGEVYISEGSDWTGRRAQMCPGHQHTRQVLVRLAEAMAGRSMDLFLLDQMNGGGSRPCYSNDHGHPPGYGRWIAENIGQLMAAVRAAGRAASQANNSDFALTMEDPGELWLPYMDLVGCRPQGINYWPAIYNKLPGSVVDSRSVPAFPFVYGRQTRCVAWDIHINVAGHPVELHNREHSLIQMARTLVWGSLMSIDVKGWMMVDLFAPPPEGRSYEDGAYCPGPECRVPIDAIAITPDRVQVDHRTFLRNAVKTTSGPALRYVNGGEMVRTRGVEAPTIDYIYVQWHEGQNVDSPQSEPAVYHSAWRLNDGEIGVIMANADPENMHSVSLPTRFAGAELPIGQFLRIVRNGEGEVFTPYRNAEGAVQTVTLNPLDVLLVETAAPPPDDPDGGVEPDGAIVDAGLPDAAVDATPRDMAPTADVGPDSMADSRPDTTADTRVDAHVDAGVDSTPDAAMADGGTKAGADSGGCGCRVSDRAPSPSEIGLFLVIGLLGRRRLNRSPNGPV